MDSGDENTPLLKEVNINSEYEVVSYVRNVLEDVPKVEEAPNVQVHQNSKISWFAAALIIANVATGSGLLNYPQATQQAGGIVNIILLQLVLVLLAQGGLVLILYCSAIANEKNLPDVVRYFSGDILANIANVFLIVHDFGACVIYLVVLGDQLDSVMSKVQGQTYCHYWYMNRAFTLTTAAVVFILPVILRKNVRSLLIGSALGVATIYYLFGLVIYKYYTSPHAQHSSRIEEPVLRGKIAFYTSPDYSIFKAVPAIIFSFQAHIEAIPVYADFKNRNLANIFKTVLLETVICLAVYNVVGIYGYLTFGSNIKSDILSCYPVDAAILVAIAAFGFKCSTAYPVAFFCPRLVIYDVFGNVCQLNRLREIIRRVIVTLSMFALSILLALCVPTIGSIISLLGGSAALFIFVFPGFCFMQHHMDVGNRTHIFKRYLGAFYIVIGIFIAAATYTQSILSFINNEDSKGDIICIPLNKTET